MSNLRNKAEGGAAYRRLEVPIWWHVAVIDVRNSILAPDDGELLAWYGVTVSWLAGIGQNDRDGLNYRFLSRQNTIRIRIHQTRRSIGISSTGIAILMRIVWN